MCATRYCVFADGSWPAVQNFAARCASAAPRAARRTRPGRGELLARTPGPARGRAALLRRAPLLARCARHQFCWSGAGPMRGRCVFGEGAVASAGRPPNGATKEAIKGTMARQRAGRDAPSGMLRPPRCHHSRASPLLPCAQVPHSGPRRPPRPAPPRVTATCPVYSYEGSGAPRRRRAFWGASVLDQTIGAARRRMWGQLLAVAGGSCRRPSLQLEGPVLAPAPPAALCRPGPAGADPGPGCPSDLLLESPIPPLSLRGDGQPLHRRRQPTPIPPSSHCGRVGGSAPQTVRCVQGMLAACAYCHLRRACSLGCAARGAPAAFNPGAMHTAGNYRLAPLLARRRRRFWLPLFRLLPRCVLHPLPFGARSHPLAFCGDDASPAPPRLGPPAAASTLTPPAPAPPAQSSHARAGWHDPNGTT